MKFKEFDERMRMFEKNLDQYVMPGAYIVVRLDGRGFSKLTEKYFQKPFDVHFKELMEKTTKAVLSCGFTCLYGYSQSDEISLLFAPNENTFGRKTRKINSTLASTASAAFTLELNKIMQKVQPETEEDVLGTFDCRVIALPSPKDVMDYFVWRQNDGIRNALNNYCYWTLRKDGMSGKAATSALKSNGYDDKIKILKNHGIDWESLPKWQKYGFGYYYCEEGRDGYDPIKDEYVEVTRRVLKEEDELPTGMEYLTMVQRLLERAE